MSKEEKKEGKDFDVDTFYRKLGVWLLVLLLVLLTIFGTTILIMQKAILKATNKNIVEKSETKVVVLEDENINNTELTQLPE